MALLRSRFTAAPVAALLIGPVLPSSTFAQSTSAATDTSRGLRIEYADGRVSTNAIRSGSMWTPNFPRIAGEETSRNGLPLSALDIRHLVDGPDVVVHIALTYGGPTLNRTEVATVRVTPDEPVTVDALRTWGVEPITLSLVAIPAAPAYAPQTVSVSGDLDVRAEPAGPNRSVYRMILTNRSPVPLLWVDVKGYRDDVQVMSGRPRGRRNEPLVMPQAEYIHELQTRGVRSPGESAERWEPLDRIEITSVMWQDGVIEGDRTAAARQLEYFASRAAHLRGLLSILRAARAGSPSDLRRAIPPGGADTELQELREVLVADLDSLERTQKSVGGEDFGTWLPRTTAECEQWLARIPAPKL